MIKHKRYKKTYKRSQRGGIWPFSESDPTAPSLTTQANSWFQSKKPDTSGWGSWFSSTPETNTTNSTTSTTSTTYSSPTTYNAPTTPTIEPSSSDTNISTVGGKRRRMRGGMHGGLGLTYYATPVSGMKVVEPNEWLLYNNGVNQQGGSRKRKCKSRKCKSRKRKCKTRRCKSRKH